MLYCLTFRKQLLCVDMIRSRRSNAGILRGSCRRRPGEICPTALAPVLVSDGQEIRPELHSWGNARLAGYQRQSGNCGGKAPVSGQRGLPPGRDGRPCCCILATETNESMCPIHPWMSLVLRGWMTRRLPPIFSAFSPRVWRKRPPTPSCACGRKPSQRKTRPTPSEERNGAGHVFP